MRNDSEEKSVHANAPTWKYRWFRFRWVEFIGGTPWRFGVEYAPRETYASAGTPWRCLTISLGPREYVFDLGKNR
jgi:hypothetical protein